MRVALNDTAALYRDAPEALAAKAFGQPTIQVVMQEVLPDDSEATGSMAGELITTTLSTVGKDFSGSPRTSIDIEAYAAAAMADMFCAYLGSLA